MLLERKDDYRWYSSQWRLNTSLLQLSCGRERSCRKGRDVVSLFAAESVCSAWKQKSVGMCGGRCLDYSSSGVAVYGWRWR